MLGADGNTYYSARLGMDYEGRILFTSSTKCIDSGASCLMKRAYILQKPYSPLDVARETKNCILDSKATPSISIAECARAEDMPIKIKSWDYFNKKWYIVSIELINEREYEITAWRREKGKSWGDKRDPIYTLPPDVTDEKLGETILEAFAYIDKNFGWDKDK